VCGFGLALFAASLLSVTAIGLWVWSAWSTEETGPRAQRAQSLVVVGFVGIAVGLAAASFSCG
jgi:hypothetical protein